MEYKKYVIKIGRKYIKGFGDYGTYKLTSNPSKAQGFNDTYKDVTHILVYKLIKEVKI